MAAAAAPCSLAAKSYTRLRRCSWFRRGDHVIDLVQGRGFRQVRVESSFSSASFVLCLSVASEGYEKHIQMCGPHLPCHFVATHPRHADVHERDIRLLGVDALKSRVTVVCRDHRMSAA